MGEAKELFNLSEADLPRRIAVRTVTQCLAFSNSNGGLLNCATVIERNISLGNRTLHEFTGQLPEAIYRFETQSGL